MSTAARNTQSPEAVNTNLPSEEINLDDKQQIYNDQTHGSDSESSNEVLVGPNGEIYPTSEDLKTLKRRHGHVPWLLYTIAFVELCERFAYYGTTVVCKLNWFSQ